MSFNCYITAHGYINEEVRIRIPWWHSHQLMKLIAFKESRTYHVVSQRHEISISELEQFYNKTLPFAVQECGSDSEKIQVSNLKVHVLVQELFKLAKDFDHFEILLEKLKSKYKPYDKFLEEEGVYITKHHKNIDEDGLRWIYDAWTDYGASEFLEVVFAYIYLKERNQLE